MKIAITGATGFIGRRLVRRVLDEGRDSVLAFSRDAGRARLRLPPEVEVVGGGRFVRLLLGRAD